MHAKCTDLGPAHTATSPHYSDSIFMNWLACPNSHGIPKPAVTGLSGLFADTHRLAHNWSHRPCTVPDESLWGHWGTAFLWQPSFCKQSSPGFTQCHNFWVFVLFLLVTLPFKMGPKHSAEVWPHASKHKRAMMCLMEKMCVSAWARVLLALSLMLTNQQYLLNKVS